MPDNPTRDFTVNDIVYHVGVLAGKVEGNNKEIALLREEIEKMHCTKEAEIAALSAATAENSKAVAAISQKISQASDFARGGITVGRWGIVAIIWIVLTGIPGAVYAWKIIKGTPPATTTQTQVTP